MNNWIGIWNYSLLLFLYCSLSIKRDNRVWAKLARDQAKMHLGAKKRAFLGQSKTIEGTQNQPLHLKRKILKPRHFHQTAQNPNCRCRWSILNPFHLKLQLPSIWSEGGSTQIWEKRAAAAKLEKLNVNEPQFVSTKLIRSSTFPNYPKPQPYGSVWHIFSSVPKWKSSSTSWRNWMSIWAPIHFHKTH